MIANFALAAFMVGLTVTIHFGGLLGLLLLFGWSTAFLFSVTARMSVMEHDWLKRRG